MGRSTQCRTDPLRKSDRLFSVLIVRAILAVVTQVFPVPADVTVVRVSVVAILAYVALVFSNVLVILPGV
jgi:hypothetical protein